MEPGAGVTSLTKAEVRELLDTYIRAWETQDPDLIVTIFTLAATYHERVLDDPIPDREAIAAYRLPAGGGTVRSAASCRSPGGRVQGTAASSRMAGYSLCGRQT
jgi:hypothetical protein